MREHPAQGQAAAPRRPDRAERALPARPAAERHGRRLHRPQAGRRRGQVRAAAARADPRATPTASSPTRNRSCASRASLAGFTMGEADMLRKAMGKKDPKVMAEAARSASWTARAKNGVNEKKADEDLRPDGVLRRLRLQQVALDGLRAARLPDGVPQGELPVALHGGAADHRGAEHRQARAVPRRVPRPRHPGAAARHQREPAGVHGDAGGRALRPDRGQERRRRGHRVDPRRARDAQGRIASLHALCEELDLRLVNKRVLESLVKAGAFDSLRHGPDDVASASCAPGCSRRSTPPSSTAHAQQRDRELGQAQLFGGATQRRGGATRSPMALPDVAAVDRRSSSWRIEKEALGLYLSGHPLDRVAAS